MRDFTLKTYSTLLNSILENGYSCTGVLDHCLNAQKNGVILRHDVDRLPENSLAFAQIQHSLGIKGTYYFRIVPESFHPPVIEAIAELGHEIGYHYEDIHLASRTLRDKGISSRRDSSSYREQLTQLAAESFQKNLLALREFYPVKTICMHGSPLSKFDNRILWEAIDYKEFGIVAEPYFEMDFSKVLYLTDTGRSWNGEKFSVRDKVSIPESNISLKKEIRSTFDLIDAFRQHRIPETTLMNFHPQRWTDSSFHWLRELLMQKMKNPVKRLISLQRSTSSG